jgi:hypothetical protein
MRMKALTIQQPYSHLIVHHQSELPEGTVQKRVENRVRRTHNREQIAIHAGVSMLWFRHGDWPCFANKPVEVPEMSFGAIVGLATIVDCVTIVSEAGQQWIAKHRHAVGPFMWVFDNVYRLKTPVPAKGQQGFWYVSEDLQQQVEAAEKILVPFEFSKEG